MLVEEIFLFGFGKVCVDDFCYNLDFNDNMYFLRLNDIFVFERNFCVYWFFYLDDLVVILLVLFIVDWYIFWVVWMNDF